MNEAEHGGRSDTGLLLGGLDGANPLAFLAALGTLRGLSIAWPQRVVRLSWEARDTWRPLLHVDSAATGREEVLAGLAAFADLRPGHGALDIGDDLTVAPDVFRQAAYEAATAAALSHVGRARSGFHRGVRLRGGHGTEPRR